MRKTVVARSSFKCGLVVSLILSFVLKFEIQKTLNVFQLLCLLCHRIHDIMHRHIDRKAKQQNNRFHGSMVSNDVQLKSSYEDALRNGLNKTRV